MLILPDSMLSTSEVVTTEVEPGIFAVVVVARGIAAVGKVGIASISCSSASPGT